MRSGCPRARLDIRPVFATVFGAMDEMTSISLSIMTVASRVSISTRLGIVDTIVINWGLSSLLNSSRGWRSSLKTTPRLALIASETKRRVDTTVLQRSITLQ